MRGDSESAVPGPRSRVVRHGPTPGTVPLTSPSRSPIANISHRAMMPEADPWTKSVIGGLIVGSGADPQHCWLTREVRAPPDPPLHIVLA
jgi:hypothetical protein